MRPRRSWINCASITSRASNDPSVMCLSIACLRTTTARFSRLRYVICCHWRMLVRPRLSFVRAIGSGRESIFTCFPYAGRPILACEMAFPPGALLRDSERSSGAGSCKEQGFGYRVCNSFASIGEASELHTRCPNPLAGTNHFELNNPPGIKAAIVLLNNLPANAVRQTFPHPATWCDATCAHTQDHTAWRGASSQCYPRSPCRPLSTHGDSKTAAALPTHAT